MLTSKIWEEHYFSKQADAEKFGVERPVLRRGGWLCLSVTNPRRLCYFNVVAGVVVVVVLLLLILMISTWHDHEPVVCSWRSIPRKKDSIVFRTTLRSIGRHCSCFAALKLIKLSNASTPSVSCKNARHRSFGRPLFCRLEFLFFWCANVCLTCSLIIQVRGSSIQDKNVF